MSLSTIILVVFGVIFLIGFAICIAGIVSGHKTETIAGTVIWILAVVIGIALLPTSGKKDVPQEVHTDVSFEEIYAEYKSNESRANEEFKGNRYRITATINGVSDGGLLDKKSSTLTLEKDVDGTIVFFYATFKDKNDILDYNVGDEITFDGTYSKAGSWYDCTVVE